MRFLPTTAFAAGCLISNVLSTHIPTVGLQERAAKIAPKIVLISMFDGEASAWYGISDFNVLEQNITVPGLSPLYPDLHCTSKGDICQLTIGEAGKFLK